MRKLFILVLVVALAIPLYLIGLAQEPVICEPGRWMDYWLVFDPEGMKRVLDELALPLQARTVGALGILAVQDLTDGLKAITELTCPVLQAARPSGPDQPTW